MLRTQGVRDLVSDVLASINRPYGQDVIEDVCLAIEADPDWLARYHALSRELRVWVVNNWIGQHTKDLGGGHTIRQVQAQRARLIGSYTTLRY